MQYTTLCIEYCVLKLQPIPVVCVGNVITDHTITTGPATSKIGQMGWKLHSFFLGFYEVYFVQFL